MSEGPQQERFWDATIELFKRLRAPMRPHPSEIHCMHQWVVEEMRAAGKDRRAVRVLVLGVTVEVVTMPWPENVFLTAVDRSWSMIHAFWPGLEPGRRQLVFGDWNALPFEGAPFDFVVGDGVFNTQIYPHGYLELGRRIRELLVPDGRVIVRGFAQLDEREDPDQIVAWFREGRINDFFELRYRLQASLQPSAEEGVFYSKEFLDSALTDRGLSLQEVYARTGYEPPPPAGHAQQASARFRVSYPTLGEYEQVLTQGYRLLGCRYGNHPLASCCPIFALAKGD